MLIIRDEQMAVFREHALKKFELQMVSHFNRYLPKQTKALGNKDLRSLIRDGMNKATIYGFAIEYDMSRYIALMLLLGPQFDTDPEFSWAKEILDDEDLGGGRGTMDVLYEKANQYLMNAKNDKEADRNV